MKQEAEDRLLQTIHSGYVGQGPRVEEFEKHLQAFLCLKSQPLATTTGTHALDLAYHLCGVGPGTSVVSTPMTCMATNTQIAVRGARIIWADIDPETGLIDPDDVKKKVEKDTVAIVAVDWSGRPANYEALKKIGPPVVQDGAHSFGWMGRGGDYRMWSFQAIKHLTCGDGGALLVPPEQRERADRLRWYGLDRKQSDRFRCSQDVKEVGYKYGMNDIQASIGLGNMTGIENDLGRQHASGSVIATRLGITPCPQSAYWFFPLLVKSRGQFIHKMKKFSVEAGEVHARNDKKECFKEFQAKLPGVDEFSKKQVNLPCGWWLTSMEAEWIAGAAVECRE
jgi:dTDP-4-amino-4,6-dideoxygalactose transaminase